MHFSTRLLLFLFVGLGLGATAFIPEPDKKDFKKLYMLQGKWIMKTRKGTAGEEWVRVGKNYLQNKAYIIKGKDTTITERVALKRRRDGIFYTSTVEEQNQKLPIDFRLMTVTDNVFIFENMAHDFPKRICYKLVNADSLHAWIDDGNEAGKKTSHFYYSRVL